MDKILEIRWHGRGGQGAKTAANLLAEAASAAGEYIQAFPEYGPERMGAPVASFNRISSAPIRIHSAVAEPDVVVILDATLLRSVPVADGLAEDAVVVVNTDKTPAAMREHIGLEGRSIFTVDANRIAMDTLGRPIPNTPMLGAVIRATGVLEYDLFMESMKEELEKKFGSRPEIVEGNLKAIERAYKEVQGE
ncbi:MAG: 2-oxoacid:acceptor oxidoreductase family protein [Bacillota bacterium]|jgi:pyruvate ferredoxin oxidoreductase gamma subunit